MKVSSRRQFLAASGGVAAAVALGACQPMEPSAPAAKESDLSIDDPAPAPASPPGRDRADFPAEFVFGFATSAYQIEGATRADGRGASIWDTFCEQPGTIDDESSGAVACDHYHRWKSDVDLMAELGTQSYRFSVAWPRVFPEGRGRINTKGLDFYRRLVARLRQRGIQPMATLFHWDLPQKLQDAGGWEDRDCASWFADYAAAVFDKLEGVESWLTINEPKIIVQQGYQRGWMAPGKRDDAAAGTVIHHLALAHGRAVQAFRASDQPGEIGPCFVVTPCYPADESTQAGDQTRLADAWANTVYFDPMLRGRYPELASKFAPKVVEGLLAAQRDGDLEIISEPVDYVGVNYYSPAIIDRSGKNLAYYQTSSAGWQQIYAEGLHDLALRIHRDYQVPLVVTENGIPDDPARKPGDDQDRIRFLRDHLLAIRRAIADGAQINGFHAWSLLDNFEWARGYTQRWGLVGVDFETQRRTLKKSATWYADVMKKRSVPTR